MNPRLRALLLLSLSALLSGGCHTFSHEWKVSGRNLEPARDIQGRWQGVWMSAVTGHTDQLRCIIQRNADGTYRARFRAKYRKVLSFGYKVSLRVQQNGDLCTFQGDANLGWYAGGLYHYEGQAGGTTFHSTYSCKYDHGTFQMGRVESNRPTL